MFSDRLGETDEGLQAAAGGAADEAVDEDGDVLEVEACGKDAPERLLEGVGEPDRATSVFELAVCDGLLGGEVLRVLQQRPAGVLEALGGFLVTEGAQLVPVVAADFVQCLDLDLAASV